MTRWIAEPENQILLVGAILMLVGAFVLICLAFPTTRTPAPPEPHGWSSFTPVTEEMPVVPDVPAAPNYVRSEEYRPGVDEFYPLAGEVLRGEVVGPADNTVTAQLSAVAAYFERIETVTVTRDVVVSHRQFDPLDSEVPTVELPQYTPDTPLFFVSKPPPPFELDSFTQGITRAQRARVLEAGRPQ